jgi:hypothetical protein
MTLEEAVTVIDRAAARCAELRILAAVSQPVSRLSA